VLEKPLPSSEIPATATSSDAREIQPISAEGFSDLTVSDAKRRQQQQQLRRRQHPVSIAM